MVPRAGRSENAAVPGCRERGGPRRPGPRGGPPAPASPRVGGGGPGRQPRARRGARPRSCGTPRVGAPPGRRSTRTAPHPPPRGPRRAPGVAPPPRRRGGPGSTRDTHHDGTPARPRTRTPPAEAYSASCAPRPCGGTPRGTRNGRALREFRHPSHARDGAVSRRQVRSRSHPPGVPLRAASCRPRAQLGRDHQRAERRRRHAPRPSPGGAGGVPPHAFNGPCARRWASAGRVVGRKGRPSRRGCVPPSYTHGTVCVHPPSTGGFCHRGKNRRASGTPPARGRSSRRGTPRAARCKRTGAHPAGRRARTRGASAARASVRSASARRR